MPRGRRLTLNGIANLIAERVVDIYRPGAGGVIPACRPWPPFLSDTDTGAIFTSFMSIFMPKPAKGSGLAPDGLDRAPREFGAAPLPATRSPAFWQGQQIQGGRGMMQAGTSTSSRF